MKKIFTDKLMHWHSMENKRIMPWKGEKDPYKIWVSEIILQQTRVIQGIAYYNNFIKEFPTIKSLATASNEAVYKVWEGLGYYSRCKNLISTARNIHENMGGKFPVTYENILSLKGIGPYTASAISSFAYGLPHAVVDGNVFRVLARYFGEALPIDEAEGKKHFTDLANNLLDTSDSAGYNQAIMDFGATICKPQIPDCHNCILQKECVAYNNGMVNQLPVKTKRLLKRKRWFTYFVFVIGDEILISKRVLKDIWENLYEFYLFETDKEWASKPKELEKWLHDQLQTNNYNVKNISKLYVQQLTHQTISAKFITIEIPQLPGSLKNFTRVKADELTLKAYPKIINNYITDTVFLNDVTPMIDVAASA